jgi:dienelactone hydrolase
MSGGLRIGRWELLLLGVVLGCGSSSSSDAGVPTPSIEDGLPSSCNPLRTPGICLLPWPNAIYLSADATSATGYRVALDADTLPVSAVSKAPLDTTRWNAADGFSPAGPILTYFAEPIDPGSLVPEANIAASLAPGAATVIVDMTTRARVAHFSGVDENATHPGDHQAIIVTPAARLLPDRRYAVAITSSIRTTTGGTPASPPLFAAIAAGSPPADALAKAEAARMPDVLAALGEAGVPRAEIVEAWDFITGSDDYLTSHVLSMRDQGLAKVGPNGAGYAITEVDDDLDGEVLRRILGTFTVPQFIDNADESKPEAELTFDAQGNPILLGTYQAPFTIIVPAVAATQGPLPVVVYGHGIFGNGEEELGDASGSYVQDLANLEGYVVVATDWIGLSSHEDPVDPGSNGALGDVLTDMNDLPWMTDRLQQALVNTMVLERTMVGRIVDDAAMTVTGVAGGAKVADPSRVFYYGVSLGGIMGMSFMGYDPDVLRGALDVGGSFWSTLFDRSVDWRLADVLLQGAYPDALQTQILLALMQAQFDFSDPATVAPHVIAAPLAGVPKKQILLQMGLGDADVPNIAAEMTARTVGLPLLRAPVTTPYGLDEASGPLPSAFTTWNVNAPPVPPSTNQTPSADNQTHEAIRRIPEVESQIATFLATGQVVDTCGGKPCVFPVPPGTPAATSF